MNFAVTAEGAGNLDDNALRAALARAQQEHPLALSFALSPMFNHVLFTAVSTFNGRMTLHVNFDAARLPLEQAIPLIADLETGLMRAAG